MNLFAKNIVGILAWTLAAGCSGTADNSADNRLNIGETDVLGERLSDYADTWEGYAEAHEFGEYGGQVRFTLDTNGVGSLRVGNAEIAAPATDPGASYPPALAEYVPNNPGLGFLSGVEYPVEDAGVSAHRLKFKLTLGVALESWCQLQTSFDWGNGLYSCLPNVSFGNSDDGCFTSDSAGARTPISCFQGNVCLRGLGNSGCTCDASGCSAISNENIAFDAALENDGNSMMGTLGAGITVRLNRSN